MKFKEGDWIWSACDGFYNKVAEVVPAGTLYQGATIQEDSYLLLGQGFPCTASMVDETSSLWVPKHKVGDELYGGVVVKVVHPTKLTVRYPNGDEVYF